MNCQKTGQVFKGNMTVIWEKFIENKLFPKNMLLLTDQHFPMTLHFVLKFLNSSSQVFVLVRWQQWDHHPVMPDIKSSSGKGPFSSCEFLLCKGSLHYFKLLFAFQISLSWRENHRVLRKSNTKSIHLLWDHSFECNQLQVLMTSLERKVEMITLSQITRNQGVYTLPSPFCKCKSNICRCMSLGWREIEAVR